MKSETFILNLIGNKLKKLNRKIK